LSHTLLQLNQPSAHCVHSMEITAAGPVEFYVKKESMILSIVKRKSLIHSHDSLHTVLYEIFLL